MNMMMKSGAWCLLLGVLIIPVFCDSTTTTIAGSTSTSKATTTTTTTTTTPSTTTSLVSSTTMSPADECSKLNGSCDKCVDNAKCLYCYTDKSCTLYPAGKVLPPSSLCALDQARWGVCWVNFEALIIACSVIGGVIVLSIVFLCVYCCCCRGRSKKKYDKEDARYEAQKMERKMKQDERRTERKGRLDEIRRKYGLVKDEAPYQRFDD